MKKLKLIFDLIVNVMNNVSKNNKKFNIVIFLTFKNIYLFHNYHKRVPFNGKYLKINLFTNNVDKLISLLLSLLGNRLRLSTSIHMYNYDLQFFERFIKEKKTNNIYVFSDGYIPVNYSIFYYKLLFGVYFSNIKYCYRDHFDFKFCLLNKIEKHKSNIVNINDSFNFIKLKKETKLITLILNHAGDWTSTINRSDTDEIIIMFSKLAQQFPNILFSIRLHPTMNNEYHDGINSKIRIESYINYINTTYRTSIKISNSSLEKDIKVSDLLITEYSNVYFEALKLNTPSLIYNPTNRISFMQELESFGFEILYDINQISNKINQFYLNKFEFYKNINKSIIIFNKNNYCSNLSN